MIKFKNFIKRASALFFACLLTIGFSVIPVFAEGANSCTKMGNEQSCPADRPYVSPDGQQCCKNRPSVNDVHVKMDNGNIDVGGLSSSNANTWNAFFIKYRTVIVGISGIGAITMIIFFIINFMKLGATSGNPQARSQALSGVLWTGIAAAGLGAVAIIAGFFYNAI